MAVYFQGIGAGIGDTDYFGPLRADGLDAVLVYSSGLDADFYFVARAIDQEIPVLSFDPGMTLVASVWAGLDEPEIAGLSGAWLDAGEGTGKLSITAADGALLDTGTYNIRATVTTDDGLEFELHSGLFRVLPAPGDRSAPSGPQYCTVEEVREYAYWLDDARMAEGNSAGLVRAIDRASRWADTTAIGRARRNSTLWSVYAYDRILTTSYDPWSNAEAAALRIKDAVENGQMDDSDPRLREAVARYAISQIPGGERKAGDMANDERKAISLMLGVTFRFDLDDDGEYEIGLGP